MDIQTSLETLTTEQILKLRMLIGEAVIADLIEVNKRNSNDHIPIRREAITKCHRSLFNHNLERIMGVNFEANGDFST